MYFADPNSPCSGDRVENAKKLLRQYFPRARTSARSAEPTWTPAGVLEKGSIGRPAARFARWVFGTLGLLVLALTALVPKLAGNEPSLSTQQDRGLLIHWQAAPGTSLQEMTRITGVVMTELQGIPGQQGGAPIWLGPDGRPVGQRQYGEIR